MKQTVLEEFFAFMVSDFEAVVVQPTSDNQKIYVSILKLSKV